MELTVEEQEAALKAALALKIEQQAAQEAAEKAAHEEAKERAAQEKRERENLALRKAKPHKWCGLESLGAVRYIPNPDDTRQRIVRADDGLSYEHTHEDADGVWIYRHL